MKKLTLKLHQILTLEIEINGFFDKNENKHIVVGFINQKIPLFTKYSLTELSKYLNTQKTIIEELKNDLIKKYGVVKDDDTTYISMYLDEENVESNVINPKFIEFEKEYNEFLNSEKEFEYTPIDFEVLKKVETTENYPMLYLLVNKEKND